MKAILRKNKTDDTMIDIVTKQRPLADNGFEFLWAVVHGDFLYGEGGALEEVFKANGEVEVEIDVSTSEV